MMMGGMAARHPEITPVLREQITNGKYKRQQDLADVLDVAGATVSRWQSGESTPSPDLWPRVEQALDLEAGTLSRAAFDAVTPSGGDELSAQVEMLGDLVVQLEKQQARHVEATNRAVRLLQERVSELSSDFEQSRR